MAARACMLAKIGRDWAVFLKESNQPLSRGFLLMHLAELLLQVPCRLLPGTAVARRCHYPASRPP